MKTVNVGKPKFKVCDIVWVPEFKLSEELKREDIVFKPLSTQIYEINIVHTDVDENGDIEIELVYITDVIGQNKYREYEVFKTKEECQIYCNKFDEF